MKRLLGVVVFGLGYVLGARAGRERYDQIMRGFTRVREDPRVQKQAHNAASVAKEQVPVVIDKVGDVASSAARKVRPSSSDEPDPDEVAAYIDEAAAAAGSPPA